MYSKVHEIRRTSAQWDMGLSDAHLRKIAAIAKIGLCQTVANHENFCYRTPRLTPLCRCKVMVGCAYVSRLAGTAAAAIAPFSS